MNAVIVETVGRIMHLPSTRFRAAAVVLCIGILAGSGCRHRTTAVDAQYNRKLENLEAQFLAKAVSPKCEGRASRPSTHIYRHDGIEVRQRCGLIYHEVFNVLFLRDFERSVCFEPRSSDSCQQRIAEMWLARLAERYEAADLEAVGQKCRAYPRKCEDPMTVEFWALRSHHEHLRDWLRAQGERIERQRTQEHIAASVDQLAADLRQIHAIEAWGNAFDYMNSGQ